MNLLLLPPNAISSEGLVTVTGRQANHILQILKLKIGSSIRVGIDNAWVGLANLVSIDDISCGTKTQDNKELKCFLQLQHTHDLHVPISFSSYTSRPRVDVILAMPRPKVLTRVLQTLATLGVGRIIITPTARVESAYFSSPKLSKESIRESLRLGLEQSSVDAMFPEVYVYASWRTFLKDLPSKFLVSPKTDTYNIEQTCIVLHPSDNDGTIALAHCTNLLHTNKVIIAIGPEGGFLDTEVDTFHQLGFQKCHMGSHILKVEIALVYALSQISLLMESKVEPQQEKRIRKDIQPFALKQCWCEPTLALVKPSKIVVPIKGPDLKQKEILTEEIDLLPKQ